MKPHRPYSIEEYDVAWKGRYAKEAEKLRSLLGDNVVDIEHIGSTSIEGMVAKPQIDILVIVKDISLLRSLHTTLHAQGYVIHGENYVPFDDDYMSIDAPDGTRLTSIHILQEGSPQINEYRDFRDYLRENSDDRELYRSMKQMLYKKYRDDFGQYDAGKTETIEAIKARARSWAQCRSTQRPGESGSNLISR